MTYKKTFKKKILKPYFTKKNHRGYKNRMNLYKEVSAIKKMVNAEKQNAQSTSTTQYDLAQFNGVGVSGAQGLGIMPVISQGVSEDQRKGDSLKIVSWCLDLNVETNSFNTLSDVKYKFYVVRQPINPLTLASSGPASFLEPNTFSNVIDYHSARNYEQYRDWVVMGTISGTLKPNTNGSTGQFRSNQHKLCRKQEFHIRYDKGSVTELNNKVTLIAVASEGDRAGTNKILFQYAMKVYYYDN